MTKEASRWCAGGKHLTVQGASVRAIKNPSRPYPNAPPSAVLPASPHFAQNINPETLECDGANGTIPYPKHVHNARRRHLGIGNTPGAQRRPFNNTGDVAYFDENNPTKMPGTSTPATPRAPSRDHTCC